MGPVVALSAEARGRGSRFKDAVVSRFSRFWTIPAFRVFLAKSQGCRWRGASGGQRKLEHNQLLLYTDQDLLQRNESSIKHLYESYYRNYMIRRDLLKSPRSEHLVNGLSARPNSLAASKYFTRETYYSTKMLG